MIDSHEALGDEFHAQPLPAVTLNEPLPAVAGVLVEVGESP